MKKFHIFGALFILLALQTAANAATMEERIAAAGAAMALDPSEKNTPEAPKEEVAAPWDMTKAKPVPYAVVQAQKHWPHQTFAAHSACSQRQRWQVAAHA
ncbi:hypothetical protein DDIC_07830 [Desulfovibrio desulfuricans]|uniref:Uncharacterized protein n=1 Tax=Desulfovibrio desulfuricans TaxID=876 RepID=A0A4P7ULJ2_DESDE|nr:hypothetical protein [Desulfovibrio desulfuricans]QCC85784.1 hypothetical protein DDIC_07830 [Desulfovibrio desulfuricans]